MKRLNSQVAMRTIYALSLAATLVASRHLFADGVTHVTVMVTDDRNRPVDSAEVVLRKGQEIISDVNTDPAGKAAFPVPPAAGYIISVQKKGYLNSQSSLDVNEGAEITITVAIAEIELSQQEIVVHGTPSNPVEEASTAPSSLDPIQAKATPSRPATLTDALPLIPAVVRRNDGSVGIAGYAENHSTLLVNSVDVTDPSTGDFGVSVPIDSVELLSVSEMPYLPQYGSFIAGVVAAETRRGGEKWSYSLNDPLPEFRIRSGHLAGLKTASPRLNFSGPLVGNRMYLSEGAEYFVFKQPVRTLPFPFNEIKSTAINTFTQLDAIVSPHQTVTATLHLAPHSLKYAGLGYFAPQPVTPDARFHEWTGALKHQWSFAGSLLQSTLAMTAVNSGIEPQGFAEMVLTPTGNRGNYFGQQSRSATRMQWIEDWAPPARHWLGEHRLRFGFVTSHSEDKGQFHARPINIEDASGTVLQKLEFTAGTAFAVSDYAPALYAHDHWMPNSHFAVDAGLRFEEQTITHTSRMAPRTGFAWTPGADGRTVLRGGIGIFYDSVPLGAYAFTNYPEQIVTSYGPSGLPLGPPIHYFNVEDQRLTQGFAFVDRHGEAGNFAPYSVAWNLSLERIVNRSVMVRFKYVQSWAQDLLTLHPETFANYGRLLLSSAGVAQTTEYQITTRIGANAQRQFFASYVRQRARGDLSDANSYLGNYPSPVIRQTQFASLPDEIPNRFLLWGTYALPKKIQLHPQIEYRSGFPYQPVNAFQQYVSNQFSVQHRFPDYFSFDLAVAKDFQIGKKHAIRFTVPLINLTNHFNALDVHSNIADPQYGHFFGNYSRHILIDFDFLN